jgi:hypothetical protein
MIFPQRSGEPGRTVGSPGARTGAAGQQDGPPSNPADLTRIDLVVALLAGAVVFGAYLATAYPGLPPIGDGIKFAFVGKVLGVPHAPGYPLYVIVSHLFSYLPFGSLSYRMNVLSGLLGAVAVALVYLVTRRMGVGRTVALSAALACGLGDAFWAKSLYAKGYTLNAALVAGGVLVLLRFGRTLQVRDLYWAAAVFAVSVGNHLTVIALLPALVLFPLLSSPRVVLRVRTALVVVLIVLVGLSQYLFILVRTLQHAPYLEAHAIDLQQLWRVMTARRFAEEIGAYSLSTLVSTRVPVVASLVRTEFGIVGLLLTVVGFASLFRRRPRHALLFGLGALGVVSLTANMSSGEDQGFLLSVFVLVWPVIGVGLDRAIAALHRLPRQVAAIAAFALVVGLPGSQVVKNYARNDHHRETFETDYFDALFAGLPSRTVIVEDQYRTDMAVRYKLLGEGAAAGRDVRLIPPRPNVILAFKRRGFDILAFDVGRESLLAAGFRFRPFVVPTRDAAAAAVLRQRNVFRLESSSVCFDVGNVGWREVTEAVGPRGRIRLRLDDRRPFDASVVIYAGSKGRREPTLAGISGTGSPVLRAEVFAQSEPDERKRLAERIADDRVTMPIPMRDAAFVTRTEIHVNDNGEFVVFGVDLGAETTAAVIRARVDQDDPKRAVVCAHPLGETDTWPAERPGATILPDATNVEFGEGWQAVEHLPDGTPFRWTKEHAVLVLAIPAPRPTTLSIRADPVQYRGRPDGVIAVVLNGHRLESRVLRPGLPILPWDVPARFWYPGLNEISLEIGGAMRPADVGLSPDNRLLGVAVFRIDLNATPTGAPPR